MVATICRVVNKVRLRRAYFQNARPENIFSRNKGKENLNSSMGTSRSKYPKHWSGWRWSDESQCYIQCTQSANGEFEYQSDLVVDNIIDPAAPRSDQAPEHNTNLNSYDSEYIDNTGPSGDSQYGYTQSTNSSGPYLDEDMNSTSVNPSESLRSSSLLLILHTRLLHKLYRMSALTLKLFQISTIRRSRECLLKVPINTLEVNKLDHPTTRILGPTEAAAVARQLGGMGMGTRIRTTTITTTITIRDILGTGYVFSV
ncbi:hypothetical protein BJ878DRAFT_98899 [Calycina marina]|uniref:Uncharacterized protein n=1 Tax=Calycina marina TaxID=1763456 RepID=A0A9P7Z251_9HELO|nr:hypothetical protein BJ878DRAFT_98899 [Calycina marina]